MTAEWLARSLPPQSGTDHMAARELARRHAPNASVDDDRGPICSGTSEIQKRIIAAELGLLG
jgi:hypothetical protein